MPPIPPKSANQQSNRNLTKQTPFYPQLKHFNKHYQQRQYQPTQFQNQPTQWQNQPTQRQNQPIQFQNQPMQWQNQPIQWKNQQIQWQNHPIQMHNQPIIFPGQQQFIPQRRKAPKLQPPSEPMDIDRSIRSQMVD